MKRIIALLLTTLIALTLCACGSSESARRQDAAEALTAYVTVSDAGTLALAAKPVTVTDADGDGAFTLSDALACAHEQYYPDGTDGYGAEETEYGITITKLWGVENGGSYGYCLNNASAMSLADELQDGDFVYAYGYADLIGWSDCFAHFDTLSIECTEAFAGELRLSYVAFDENFNPVDSPLAGAEITVNGEPTGIVTDEAGAAELELTEPGEYLVSAETDERTITPPVCLVTVG